MFQENIEIIKNNFLEVKGTGMYIALFLISLIYIFLKEKEKNKKSLLVYFSLLIFFIILNPIFNKIVGKIFTKGVYWRVFWMLPVGISISYAGVSLINEGKEKLEKIVALIGMVVIIMVSGKFIYNETNFQKVGNLYKLPDDAVYIAQIIGKEEEEHKKVLATEYLVPYIRQIDSNIGLAYKREPEGYADNKYVLTLASGDTEQITKMAIENNCNYIVMDRNVKLTLDFHYFGFVEVGGTDKYAIYKTENLK